MKYLSLALIIITAMILNLIADLNFPRGSPTQEAWDKGCGMIFGFGIFILVAIIIFDTLKDDE